MAKKKKQNKDTVIALIGLIIIVLGVLFIKKPTTSLDTAKTQNQKVGSSITITSSDIKETNFTGTKPLIVGKGVLADTARKYIDETIASFKQSADTEVPPMRIEFGNDSPTANYEIDLDAKYTKSTKTESIIIDQYVYTGGANGSSSFKVFTASLATGKIMSLSDVVAKKDAFTTYVKKALNDWRPEGSTETVVFPEDVEALTFDSFTNWSFDDQNLIIYFDKYEVGPGVLGGVAFPLPISKIKNLLVAGY